MSNSASNNLTTTYATAAGTGGLTLSNKPATDNLALVAISGTYGTVTITMNGSVDGTNLFPISAIDYNTGAVVTGNIAPSDNATRAWLVPCVGLSSVVVKCTAISSGTVAARIDSGAYTILPVLNISNAAGTFTSIAASGGLTTSGPTGAGLGYATGAGGSVTQGTNRSTGVTLSKLCGQITTDTTSLAAGAEAKFTVTNTTVAATDTVVISLASGNTSVGSCMPEVTAVGSGSFDITITNTHASAAEVGACVINFAVIKAVAA